MVLQLTPIIKQAVEEAFQLEFDYTLMNEVMLIVKQYQCSIKGRDDQLFCKLEISIPRNRLPEVLDKLRSLKNLDLVKME